MDIFLQFYYPTTFSPSHPYIWRARQCQHCLHLSQRPPKLWIWQKSYSFFIINYFNPSPPLFEILGASDHICPFTFSDTKNYAFHSPSKMIFCPFNYSPHPVPLPSWQIVRVYDDIGIVFIHIRGPKIYGFDTEVGHFPSFYPLHPYILLGCKTIALSSRVYECIKF